MDTHFLKFKLAYNVSSSSIYYSFSFEKSQGETQKRKERYFAIIRSYLILDTYIYAANKYPPFKIKNNTGNIFHITSQTGSLNCCVALNLSQN